MILETHPPRPVNGVGEVEVEVGDASFILKWEEGQLKDVRPSEPSFNGDVFQMTLQGGAEHVVTCFKCARDSQTGNIVCWDVPC